ncbi:MAG TPA: trypsin-like peptidase domain-containing protein [Gemmataceae bacterium]|nr:trypsin-like peptidase domain-containing protein [Gemmataceae bacterium]
MSRCGLLEARACGGRRPAAARAPKQGLVLALLVGFLFVLGGAAAGAAWLLRPAKPSAAVLVQGAEPRPVAPVAEPGDDEKATIDIFKAVSPSVVHVTNLGVQSQPFRFDVQETPRGTGTGFVWNENGFIVTNYHVVEGASKVRVVLSDHSSYDSTQFWGYPDKDLAVVWIDAPKEKLKPIPVGTSHDLQVGQKTYAIGNPFGLDQTLTTGVVSALGREIESANGRPIRGVIQTSAPINPGNSGGPLLDRSGRLIGVNTAILSPSGTFAGIGFAIPVDEVNRLAPQLIAHGKIVRPRMGVQVAEDEQAHRMGAAEGALILRASPGGPADRAGLRGAHYNDDHELALGDVVTAVDGQPIRSGADLFAALEQHQAGDAATVAYLRNGQRMEAKVTLEVGD